MTVQADPSRFVEALGQAKCEAGMPVLHVVNREFGRFAVGHQGGLQIAHVGEVAGDGGGGGHGGADQVGAAAGALAALEVAVAR